jgi:hypothetical protein
MGSLSQKSLLVPLLGMGKRAGEVAGLPICGV